MNSLSRGVTIVEGRNEGRPNQTLKFSGVNADVSIRGSEAYLSVELVGDNLLTSKALREAAETLDKGRGSLLLASDEQSVQLLGEAKNYLATKNQDISAGVAWVLAEYIANSRGLTMYSHYTTVNPVDEAFADNIDKEWVGSDDYDDEYEDEEDSWLEEEDEDDYEEEYEYDDDDYEDPYEPW
jgi:hypothetical protein